MTLNSLRKLLQMGRAEQGEKSFKAPSTQTPISSSWQEMAESLAETRQ